jgi:DNA-binding CsgD family transcriptional regulator
LTPALVDTRAGGRIVHGSKAADAMLDALLSGATRVRSFALPPHGGRAAQVAHVIPLAPAIRDPLSSAVALLVLNVAGAARSTVTDLWLLHALFDLSAAESRVAAALATGLDLTHAAQQCGIATSTARSYLERIFQKTGCHRQSELVLLLAGLVSLPGVGDADGSRDSTGAVKRSASCSP